MRRFAFLIIGLLSGAVIGVAASVLSAPASGNAMRAEARGRFDQLMLEAQAAAETRRAELETQFTELTHTPGR